MRVGLYPHLGVKEAWDQWWQTANRDFPWWNNWFEQYRILMLHYADIADQTKVTALILGGEWLSPALPGGLLKDGSPSGVPEDANERWIKLIGDIRSHYQGQIIWALPYPEGINSPPEFLFHRVYYISWDAKLSDNANESKKPVSKLYLHLDNEILPQSKHN
jgi:hypothetical protein